LHQTTGYRRTEDSLAAHDGPDRTQDLGLEGAFQEVASRPGLQGGEDRVLILEHADDEDGYVGARPQYATRGFYASYSWHAQVHKDDVGL
jgi:hypothetical protein